MDNKEDNKMYFDAVEKIFAADNMEECPFSKDVSFESLPQPTNCVRVPCDFTKSVCGFIKELKEVDESLKNKKKKTGLVWCFIGIFILLCGVYLPLYYWKFFRPTSKPVEISDQPTFHKVQCCCCEDVFCPALYYEMGYCFKGDSAYYDVMEVAVAPNGTITSSYRKFDKLIIVLAIILTVCACTALICFILYKRKSIVADHEREQLELENQNKLVNKYVEALLAEQQFNIQYNEEQLSLARQKQLYKMDMHQKEHDNWWKHVASRNETKKTVVLAMIEADKDIRKGKRLRKWRHPNNKSNK